MGYTYTSVWYCLISKANTSQFVHKYILRYFFPAIASRTRQDVGEINLEENDMLLKVIIENSIYYSWRKWLSSKISIITICCNTILCNNVDSVWPSDAIWRDRSWSTMVREMVCHPFGTQSLTELKLACYLKTSDKLHWNLNHNSSIFRSQNAFKMSAKWRPFCSGLNMSRCPHSKGC